MNNKSFNIPVGKFAGEQITYAGLPAQGCIGLAVPVSGVILSDNRYNFLTTKRK